MIIVSICSLLIIIYLFQRKFATQDSFIYYLFVSLKLISAILVGLLYQEYYQISGDTFTIFKQAKEWYSLFLSDEISFLQWIGINSLETGQPLDVLPLEPRTRFFAYVVSFLMPISASNYYLLAIWLTLFSIQSIWILSQVLIHHFNIPKWVTYVSVLFLPSVLFWSAGLLKETLMMAFIALLLVFYLNYSKSKAVDKWLYLASMLVVSILLYQIKYYVIIVLFPVLIITHEYIHNKGSHLLAFLSRRTWYALTILVGILILAFFHPVFYSGYFFEMIQISHDSIAARSSGALIQFIDVEEPFLFALLNAPLAIFTGLFRPFIWEGQHELGLLLSIESTCFIFCFAGAIYSLLKVKLNDRESWWLFAMIIYVGALATIICLSTPNFGTLARYRVAYMPFCWLACLWLIDKYFVKPRRKD